MSTILIAYGTSEGQTAKIAEQLAGFILAQGHDVVTADIARGAPAPAGYQAVIVGASVHKGKHQRWVVDYARRNRPALEHLPSAFFSVRPILSSISLANAGSYSMYLKAYSSPG